MILVTGDSHAKFWKFHPGTEVHGIGEATAYGLWNGERYGTKAATLMAHLAANRKRYRAIVCCFGEIDCRAHIVKRAAGSSVATQALIVAQRYRAFQDRLRDVTGRRVCSIGPPCAAADETKVDPAFPRFGTQAERDHAIWCFDRYADDDDGTHFRIADLMTPADLPDGVHAGDHLRPKIAERCAAAFA